MEKNKRQLQEKKEKEKIIIRRIYSFIRGQK
jgi:hypothetical protein